MCDIQHRKHKNARCASFFFPFLFFFGGGGSTDSIDTCTAMILKVNQIARQLNIMQSVIVANCYQQLLQFCWFWYSMKPLQTKINFQNSFNGEDINLKLSSETQVT